jgi:glycosyltransferase involved in cell wall biosynthesis
MCGHALSVVVIGRNEGARLVRCIQSVQAMPHRFGSFEVIYVDSCSSDGSAARAAAMGATVIELSAGPMCAARARNAGWQVATAPFVLFLDADTVLNPDFPARALTEFTNAEIAVVYGDRREIATQASIYNRVLDLDWIDPPGLKSSCGGDAVFRRSVLENTGGFNPKLIAGEEPELCRRICAAKGLILRIDFPMTGHDLGILSWRQYWRRAVRTGHAFAEVSTIYRKTDFPLWLAESRSNILNGSLYLAGMVVALAATLRWHSWIYMALYCGMVMIRAVRTAIKSRWKSSSAAVLFLYGLHSHIQQIPILVGQLRYWLSTKTNSQTELIEYKVPWSAISADPPGPPFQGPTPPT